MGGARWSSRIRSRESEKDGVRISGAVCGIGVSTQCQGVEDTPDVIFLDGSQERVIRRRIMGLCVRAYGIYVCSVDVFGSDKAKTLLARCLRLRLLVDVESSFPDHVRDTIADLEQDLDNVGAERRCIKS